MKSNKIVTALNAVTQTTTSEVIGIEYAEKVTILLTRANHGSGSSAFTVEGSIDGTTYIALNTLLDNATGVLTHVSSKTLSADGSALIAIDLKQFGYKSIKVIATETTDGSHSAVVYVEY